MPEGKWLALAATLLTLGGCDPGNSATKEEPCPQGQVPCGGMCVPLGSCGASWQGGTGGVANPSGGMSALGGAGSAALGGRPNGSGGAVAAGGNIIHTPECNDTGSGSETIVAATEGRTINANDGKSYWVQTNWWNPSYYKNQSVAYNGLSFTVKNPENVGVGPNVDEPMGYPSMFIGSYTGNTTSNSGLPKKVSDLTSVPTIFSTNGTQLGMDDYNAAYDVWFTPSAALLGDKQYSPPIGGAYLMVWLFMPNHRQPRGSRMANGKVVSGVSGNWDAWVDNSDPPCISYVSTNPLDSLNFDLKDFITDSVKSNYGITESMYLSIIFAGFEVWDGGDGLQAKKFCAEVE